MDLKVLDGRELAIEQAHEREWLVEGWLPLSSVSLMTGDGGVGKSGLALLLAYCCATTTEWVGLKTKKCTSIFVSAEDDKDELHRRTRNVLKSCNEFSDDFTVKLIDATIIAGPLTEPDSDTGQRLSAFGRSLHSLVETTGAKLLVLDTLANFFVGNENDRGEVTSFIRALNKIATENKCTVLLLAHPNKFNSKLEDQRYSGSTAWNGSVRSRLHLEKKRGDLLALNLDKANYGKAGLKVRISSQRGSFEVVESHNSIASNNAAKCMFLKLLRTHNDKGIMVSPNPSKTYAPKVFEQLYESNGFTSTALKSAMDALIKEGKVEVLVTGPKSKRRQHLFIASWTPALTSRFDVGCDSFVPWRTHDDANEPFRSFRTS